MNNEAGHTKHPGFTRWLAALLVALCLAFGGCVFNAVSDGGASDASSSSRAASAEGSGTAGGSGSQAGGTSGSADLQGGDIANVSGPQDGSGGSGPQATAPAEPQISADGTYYAYDELPDFSAIEGEAFGYESYSELDALGRCGTAEAILGEETAPAAGEERGSISSIRPSGWKQAYYPELIAASNGALFNRSHLIAWSLGAENANERNLIAGTRQLNETMTRFEKQVARHMDATGGHVCYRVTPDFRGGELVARGVLMEALSVEDGGKGVCFKVYIPNVQAGVEIDYRTGDSRLA
ncbi:MULTISPECIES: DNA/RNA non-specific endonuclease [unclassified Adlercreutzia]|uniref:DNA/RNA non-specific endonuclease n=1 Tax=unclassified Adlercreutzia TaxID=2636013 RepID=UPI0013EB662A|nr:MULTISPECIES: DNA/RNA non-specific endonuclease [unclassified Adlercreutzia]